MKKLSLLLMCCLWAASVFAQTAKPKEDVLQKVNGEEMTGRVVKVSDDEVTFVYSGETAEYTVKKADIAKIIHGSGRIETFSPAGAPAQLRKNDEVSMSASPADHHNKIAVLPFTFLMDNQPGAEAIGLKAQEDAYSFLTKHSAGYTLVDPRTTNAMLAKAGVTADKMANFTMKELCDILGVEYVIDGTVTQNKGYQTSYSSDNSNSKVKRDRDDKVKGISSYGSSSSSAAQRYDVSVSLHIYMDNNASIYNQSHKAFLSNTDGSYSSPLEYLLKRSPLYRK